MRIRGLGYAAEKFDTARRFLMAPHPEGEAHSYFLAFHECDLGLGCLDVEAIDDKAAQDWIQIVKKTMDTAGIDDPTQRGTWLIKAEQLNIDEKTEFSRAVDELAGWFRATDRELE